MEVEVTAGVVTLTGRVDRWSVADATARLTRQVAGVVDVDNKLVFSLDARELRTTATIMGVS